MERPACKATAKNRNRPVIDSMIVICLLLSETSLFITCLPCCRIPPNNQSPWSSSPLPPNLDPPTNLSINNRWPIWNRNYAQKIERKPLVLPHSTLFTFCLLLSKKDFLKNSKSMINRFFSMSAVPAAINPFVLSISHISLCNLKILLLFNG